MFYDVDEYNDWKSEEIYFEMSQFSIENYELLAKWLIESQERLSRHSIYLLSNTEILREYLDFAYGDGKKIIIDLQKDIIR